MDTTKIEVEYVSDDDTAPPLHESEYSGSDDNDDKDEDIHPLISTHGASPKLSYVNSEGLRCFNRDHEQPTYPIVTGQYVCNYE